MPTTQGIFAGTVVFGTTPTTSTGIRVSQDWIGIVLNLTGMTGAGSIVLEVQWSDDGGTWASASPPDVFDALTTAPASVVKRFDVKAEYFRVAITVTGANSPTFSGTANAYV